MAGGGGAWKVAYADFVTAMMAFFMVMWLVSQNAKVREAIAEHFREPDPLSVFDSTKSGNSAGRDKRGKKHYAKSTGSSQTPTLDPNSRKNARLGTQRQSDASGVSFLVNFPEDQAQLDEETKKSIDRFLGQVLGKSFKLEIRGHSSRRPLPEESPYKDHWDLCYQRCQAVREYLVEKGVEAERLRISQAGIYEPRSIRADAKWEAGNARVEVTMLAEVAEDLKGVAQERNALYTEQAHEGG
jgi:chemotaxis protein MotB